jgi:hypothetical protein
MFVPAEKQWLAEGFADYINEVQFGDYVFRTKSILGYENSDRRLVMMRACYDGTYYWGNAAEVIILANGTWLPEYYLSHGGSFDADAELHVNTYIDAEAYMQYRMGEYLNAPELLFSDENSKRRSGIGYGDYVSFVNYLVKNYSLQQVLTVCTDYNSLDETFGKDFTTLYDEWHAWVFRDENG